MEEVPIWKELTSRITREKIEDWLPYNLPLLVSGLIISGLGAFLIIDDVRDYGLFSTPKHPMPIHHWQLGAFLFMLGLIIIAIAVINLLR